MFSYLVSFLGYPPSYHSSPTTTVTVELGPQQPVTVEIPNNALSHRIINWFAEFAKAMQENTIEQSLKANKEIYNTTFEVGRHFSKVFFASKICKDSDLKENKEKWEICFKEIEEVVERAFEEIYRCTNRIVLGYLNENGMPLFMVKSLGHGDPIYLGNQEEIKKSDGYLNHLLDKMGKNGMPDYEIMSNIYMKARKGMPSEIRTQLPLQEPLNQYLGDGLFHFLTHKVEEVWMRISEKNKLKA